MSSRADYLQGNSDDTETSDEEVDEDVEDDGTGAASSEDDVDTEMEPDSQISSRFIDMPDSFEESSLTDFDIEV